MKLIPWKGKHRKETGAPAREPAPVAGFRSEMDRLFDRFFGGVSGFGSEPWGALEAWSPSVDVSETDKELTVRAEVPGIRPEDLEITAAGGVLSISGEKREEKEEKGRAFHRVERRFGSFRRQIALPSGVDESAVKAEHKDGILTIRIPKAPGAGVRKIPVQRGGA